MINLILTYLFVGLVWSFIMKVVHDFTPDLPDDLIPNKQEYDKTMEPYKISELFYIMLTWPYWIILFIRIVVFNETK